MRKGVRLPHTVVKAIEDEPIFTHTYELKSLRAFGAQGPERAILRLQRYGLRAVIDPSNPRFVTATPVEPCTVLVQFAIGRGSGGPLRICRKYFDDFTVAQTGNFWLVDNPQAPAQLDAVTGDFSEIVIECSPTNIVPKFVVLSRRDQALEREPVEVPIPESALQ